MNSLINIPLKPEPEHFIEITLKSEPAPSSETVQTCKLCLAPQSAARLTRRDLAAFYCLFRACGLGIDIPESSHSYSWVCQYCWVRACQCVQFIECARKAEQILNNLKGKDVTEEILSRINETSNTKAVQLSESTCSRVPANDYSQEPSDITKCFIIGFSQPPPYSPYNLFTPYNNPQNPYDFRTLNDYTSSENLQDDSMSMKKTKVKRFPQKRGQTKHHKKPKVLKKVGKKSSDQTSAQHNRWLKKMRLKIIYLTKEEQFEQMERKKKADRYVNAIYKCEKCAVGFKEVDAMSDHQKIHDVSRGEYVCDICEKRYPDAASLLYHEHRHQRLYQCLLCGVTVADRVQANIHHTRCSDGRPAVCDQCGKVMSDTHKLRRHVARVHAAPRKFSCDVCGRAFKAKQTIRTHMRIHTGETPFQCSECGKKTTSFTLLSSHMLIHAEPGTKEEQAESFCVECDQQFKSKIFLKRHLNTSLKHISKDSFKFTCASCGARLSSSTGLRNHMNAKHLEIRSHACAACDKAFYYRSSLILHVKEKHTDTPTPKVKKYICQVCGKSFQTSGILKSHSRIHKDERPFACLLCPATFKFNAALYTHCKLKHKMTPAQVRNMFGSTSFT